MRGRFLHDGAGKRVILRGVNLALLDDWRFPGADWLDQVSQTGANAVRLQWYVDYGNAERPPYALADLDDVLTRCVDAYTAGLAAIRNAGLAMPVMIDAPDCGTSLDAFVAAGRRLVAADPAQNLLLSVHAYWAEVDYSSAIPSCVSLDLPLVFGEIANREDDTDDNGKLLGYIDLAGPSTGFPDPSGFRYQALLRSLKADDIGWLAWAWYDDNCHARRLSSDGSFAHLSTYGHDIVHNTTYGLLATAVRVAA